MHVAVRDWIPRFFKIGNVISQCLALPCLPSPAADVANSYKGLSRTIGHAWSTATSGTDQWRVVSLICDALLDAVAAAVPVFLDDARSAAARLFALTRLFAIVECVRKTRSAHLLLGVRIQRYGFI